MFIIQLTGVYIYDILLGKGKNMTMYRIQFGYFAQDVDTTGIKEVVIDRTTDKSVWVKGCRHARQSELNRYYENYEEAKKYYIKSAKSQIETMENRIACYKQAINNLK